MSSPRLQHTTGGGLNSFRASKPVLFANKMQLWVNHRLSPTCWHMHPHTQETHALTRQDRLVHAFHAKLSSPSVLRATETLEWNRSHVYTHWLTDVNSLSEEFEIFTCPAVHSVWSGQSRVVKVTSFPVKHLDVWVMFKSSPAQNSAQYRPDSDWSESRPTHVKINQL